MDKLIEKVLEEFDKEFGRFAVGNELALDIDSEKIKDFLKSQLTSVVQEALKGVQTTKVRDCVCSFNKKKYCCCDGWDNHVNLVKDYLNKFG